MKEKEIISKNELWACFRFSVIGKLLSSPPEKGELKEKIKELSESLWVNPITKKEVSFGFSTIESWYYRALRSKGNPILDLEKKSRNDSGRFKSFSQELKNEILRLHEENPSWSHQLHYDNILALKKRKNDLGKIPSYTSFLRYRKEHNLFRIKTKSKFKTSYSVEERKTFRSREIRSYENKFVNGLWHTDFHHCSRALLRNGKWVKPKLAAVMDDHSRIICHLQWYWEESAQNLIHSYMQAFLKCGLPKSLLSDNGGPMTASETKKGLERLGILAETTLPYSPYQNGKQEHFFSLIEGRLMPMLLNKKELTLDLLNKITHAWLEEEYQIKINSTTKQSPKERFMKGKYIGREAPSMDEMEKLFCIDVKRKLRKTDGTIQLEGTRFEVPNHHRHFNEIIIRYASFRKKIIWLVNETTGKIIERLYPVDYEKNSSKERKIISVNFDLERNKKDSKDEIAILLQEIMKKNAEKNLPINYLRKED